MGESGPWWHLRQLTQYPHNPFLWNSGYVRKVTPICLSHSESNFPIFTAKTFVTQTNWCLAWWANFPLKEEFWPMWANIPFKQYWCIQIKVQEAGNLTVNFALSWCLLTFILSPWGPSGPQKSLWSTLYPFLFFPLWYDLVITRPATQTVLSLRQVSGSNSLFFPETHDLYIHDSFRSSRCSYFSLTTQSASEVHRKLAFKTKENIQTRVG